MCRVRRDREMIPTIGLIVGLYVILRSLDLIFAATTRYSTEAVRVLMIVASGTTILLTAFLMVDLFFGSIVPTVSFDSTTPSAPVKDIPATPQQRREIQELIRKTNEGH